MISKYSFDIKNKLIINKHEKKEFSKLISTVLQREKLTNEIKELLLNFDKNCKNINFKKGIYIYGATGCGKTEFVMDLLNELDYDVIKYDAGDIRNKSLIDTITSNNISTQNVLHMMNHKVKKIVILMDEIDGMNNGDKGGITSLIKLIRQKKTKKQKTEDVTLNPIICIGNYFMDKKIRELMKVCNVFEIKSPTNLQVEQLLKNIIPTVYENTKTKQIAVDFIQQDLRKLQFFKRIYENNSKLIIESSNTGIFQKIFKSKIKIEDAKKITETLIHKYIPFENHNTFMNETDRTIVALLWHENIVDSIQKTPISLSFPFYEKILSNMCFSDYIDRITFQNQIWQFNEMSSMMKTFYNNTIYHTKFPDNSVNYKPTEIRFTKVLTKYSTEYNNQLFLYNMCQELDMDKKDMISFFQELRLKYGIDFLSNPEILVEIDKLFENSNINKLDIKRIYRYLDKNVKKEGIDEILEEEFNL
jgi:hydroxymethylpyrimidine pyrophosphatase-like HAD family hydrolase